MRTYFLNGKTNLGPMLFALAVLGLMATPAVARTMTDQEISDAIEDEFIFDRAINANNIDISVTQGIATLSGSTNNLLAKQRAARIAETVKGVRSVINQVVVKPTVRRHDPMIQQDVKNALLTDPATDSYEIDVSVSDGTVTLTGTVQSWAEKQLSAKVAKGVNGVKDLINEITVAHKADRSDSEIKSEIVKSLRWDTLVDHALIDVEVDDGKVTLTGTVGSAAEKRQARYNAWVGGVTSVDASGLEVKRWARDEDLRKDKYTVKSAEDLKSAINDALLYDPRVMSFNVTPDIAGSTVTLRGKVDNLKAKRAAEQVARNTVGVTYVTNRIKVRPAKEITDKQIAKNIRDAMIRDPYVEKFEIDVSVSDGTAYLSGTVDSYFEKAQADDIAARINGVTRVRNNLDVDYTGPLAYDPYVYDENPYLYDWYDYEPLYTFESDSEIKEEINDEIWWNPFVDSDDVTVKVEDGTATLTGTVDSWSEFNAATENAFEGGAVWVDNNLTVE